MEDILSPEPITKEVFPSGLSDFQEELLCAAVDYFESAYGYSIPFDIDGKKGMLYLKFRKLIGRAIDEKTIDWNNGVKLLR